MFTPEILRKGREALFGDEETPLLVKNYKTKGKLGNYIIVIFIMISVVLAMFESIGNNGTMFLKEIFITDLLISIIFGIEYFYRLSHSSSKKKFIFKPMNVLDLLSFLPFFIFVAINGVGSYIYFAIFRIFRIFRVFELLKQIPILMKMIRGITLHKVEYQAAIFIIFIILIAFATVIYEVEKNVVETTFTSIPQSLWWGVVTMTNVGYGDMIPQTITGKIIGSFIMFLGPILIAIISSITVVIFLESTRAIRYSKRGNGTECNRCTKYNSPDSSYCRYCGELLTTEEEEKVSEKEISQALGEE